VNTWPCAKHGHAPERPTAYYEAEYSLLYQKANPNAKLVNFHNGEGFRCGTCDYVKCACPPKPALDVRSFERVMRVPDPSIEDMAKAISKAADAIGILFPGIAIGARRGRASFCIDAVRDGLPVASITLRVERFIGQLDGEKWIMDRLMPMVRSVLLS